MQVTVFIENWQMDCCGEPFAVGEIVEWDCNKTDCHCDYKGADYQYEAHDIAGVVVRGVVANIDEVIPEYETVKNGILRPKSYTKKPMQQATRFGAKYGFLVQLHRVKLIQ